MHSPSKRFALAFTSLAMILGTAACGGGGDADGSDARDQASAAAADSATATARAKRRPPPPPAPPPVPTTDATLALASATASSQAVDGDACAVSGDGGKVLFTSVSSTLVAGDVRTFAADIFLKNFNGNGVVRAVTTFSRSLTCLTMTPDANTVVFMADATNGQVDVLGNSGTELAIMVQNLATGQQTRVTPLLTGSGVTSFEFAGISDDGLRVAFIGQPSRVCSGYDCTATSAPRMFLRDLATGALINLDSKVRFTTTQGVVDGDAWLAPNGRTLAFSSRAAYPEAGDVSPQGDVFALDIASGNVRLVNTDAAGRQLTFPGFGGVGPTWGVQSFLANSGKIAFNALATTSAGPAGVYVKDLTTGALSRVLDSNITYSVGNRQALSFSEDGRKVAYVESTGGGITANSIPRVLDLTTGARTNAATLTNGTVGNGPVTTNVLLARDGRSVAFGNNATNLLGARLPGGGAEQRAYRKQL